MFDFSLTEVAVFGVVVLVALGPKDLPVAMRAAAGAIKKARRMAAEFQGHVDEMMREANMDEMREHLREIRNFDITRRVTNVIDPDREMSMMMSGVNVTPVPETVIARPDETDIVAPPPAQVNAPAFVPPGCVPGEAPAFVPPRCVL